MKVYMYTWSNAGHNGVVLETVLAEVESRNAARKVLACANEYAQSAPQPCMTRHRERNRVLIHRGSDGLTIAQFEAR